MIKENLIKLYENSFKENWELPALSDYFKSSESYTYEGLVEEIIKLHVLFEQLQLKRGDKIALLGRNNPKWCITFMATITYGAVIVPILQDFNSNDIHHIINHSDSKVVFAGDQFWDNIDTKSVDIKAAFSLTDFECIYAKIEDDYQKYIRSNVEKKYRRDLARSVKHKSFKFAEVDNSEMVLLNYTSGTTGFSKGVMVSANNIAGNVFYVRAHRLHHKGSRALVFLPLAHTYGCTLDFLYPLTEGTHITLLGKIPAPKILVEALSVVRPDVIFTVPLLVEKIYKQVVMPVLDKEFIKVALRTPLLDTGMYSLINRKLTEVFGGNFSQVVIGGAPLNADVEEFLKKIKFRFTVGYGMTECAPLISYEDYEKFKQTSCGKILDDIMDVKIASDDPYNIPGEIRVKGENVMMGYYKNEEETRKAFDEDGWLRTGDIGTIDPDGTIYIKGRSKSMILGSAGQNIYPEGIESKLNNLPCVFESLVIERNGKLVALVYPDYNQMNDLNISESNGLKDVMANNLKELNKLVAPFEKVSEIVLYPHEFEKTPKKSIKRYLYEKLA